MKIDKAIEILTIVANEEEEPDYNDYLAATELSIEALKRCRILAENNPLWAAKPLPGETKE